MHKFFSIVTYVFMAFYAFALFMMLSSTFGLFGVEQDPMSGIFLILLGQPWVRWVDMFPEAAWPWLTAIAPAITLGFLWLACRTVRRGSAK